MPRVLGGMKPFPTYGLMANAGRCEGATAEKAVRRSVAHRSDLLNATRPRFQHACRDPASVAIPALVSYQRVAPRWGGVTLLKSASSASSAQNSNKSGRWPSAKLTETIATRNGSLQNMQWIGLLFMRYLLLVSIRISPLGEPAQHGTVK